MGKIDQTGKGKFTITYGGLESPMSGIDATHQSGLYLEPTSLAAAGGVMSQDGYLNTVFMNPRVSINIGSTSVYTIGDIQATVANVSPVIPTIGKISIGFIVVSQGNNLNLIEFKNGIINGPTSTLNISNTNNQAMNLCWYAINGVVYITGLGLGAIYYYAPSLSGTSTFALLTNYIGGTYLGELNGRLLCMACDQYSGGGTVYNYFPFRISWSAPQGNYSQWNPLVGGLVTGAGYNNLPDVADEITGFFAVGPTGYILRKQGITEVSPLNSGIQPFDFNHLWASAKGIGSNYPFSIAQYGSLGAFIDDTGVFTLGYGGVKEIQGLFWAELNRLLDELFVSGAIYIDQLQSVVAGMVPLYINNERKLVYAVYIPNSEGLLFVGDVKTQSWNSISCYTATQAIKTQIRGLSYSALFNIGPDQTISLVTAAFYTTPGLPGGTYNLVFFTLDDTLQLPSQVIPVPFVDASPYAIFPIEEVVMNRDITIDAIGIIADADVNAGSVITVTPNISNFHNLPGINYLSLSFNAQSQFLKSYPVLTPNATTTAMFTGKYPQLALNINMDPAQPSSLRVYKITLYCSFDPQQEP